MYYFIVFIYGIIIGSFLNVCIYRIPLKQDIVYTSSHCMNCGTKVKWYDLIPVVSYLVLAGKCRTCKTKLSKQYPLIELLNGAAYLGIFHYLGLSYEAGMMCVLFSVLLVITLIDIRYKIIPNSILIFLMIIGIVYVVLVDQKFISSIIGFFAVSLILLIIAVISNGQMGGGDIKLMAVCGFIIGWQKILVALLIGSVFGSIIGVILIILKINKKKQQIPFGPYLSAGVFVAALFGTELIQWYLNLVF